MTSYALLHPATFRLDGGAMFGIIPKPLWEKAIKPDEQNRILMSLRVFIYDFGSRKVIIDSGIGDYHGEKFENRFDIKGEKNPLLNALDASPYKPEDITDIVLTHLHFDHVGGLGHLDGENFIPVSPKATLHLHKDHFEYAKNPTVRDAGSFQSNYFLPLIEYYQSKNQIHWVEGDSGKILEKLFFKTSHGHTPHQIHPYDEKVMYMADILPMSHHLSIPWVMGYDINPGQSTRDKEELYKFIQEKNLAVVFEHDNEFWGGRIAQDDKGRPYWQQKFESTKELYQKIEL